MNKVEDIAAAWGADGPICLIAERENAVYRVSINDAPVALRLHRKGYQEKASILSELIWTNRLADAEFSCPRPVSMPDGSLLLEIDGGRYASVISWVDGMPIGRAEEAFDGTITEHCDLYRGVGLLLAELHNVTDSIKTNDITRPSWNLSGLLGKSPFWGRFWENPSLSASEKKFMIYARDAAYAHLEGMKDADFGLIHADALQENIFSTPSGLTLIDFDDSGFGYRGYDLGALMSQHYTLRYLDDLIEAVRDGYGVLRPAPSLEDIHFFLMLRGFASSGWVIPREPKKSTTQRRYAERALHLSYQWLN